MRKPGGACIRVARRAGRKKGGAKQSVGDWPGGRGFGGKRTGPGEREKIADGAARGGSGGERDIVRCPRRTPLARSATLSMQTVPMCMRGSAVPSTNYISFGRVCNTRHNGKEHRAFLACYPRRPKPFARPDTAPLLFHASVFLSNPRAPDAATVTRAGANPLTARLSLAQVI